MSILNILLNKKLIKLNRDRIDSVFDKKTLPLVVNFETRTKCNSNCYFCPASIQNETRNDRLMSYDIFKKGIDDLKEFDYNNFISFYLNNEPLMDKRILKFVEYANKQLPSSILKIGTNGILLTDKKVEKFIDSGIKVVDVCNYTNSVKQRDKLDGIKNRYPDVVKVVHSRSYNEKKLNRGGKTQINNKMVDIAEKDFDINNDYFCLRPFIQLTVNYKGDIGLCCFDVYFDMNIGNVYDDNIINIWYNGIADGYRKSLLNGNRRCCNCCVVCDALCYDSSGYNHPSFMNDDIRWWDFKYIYLLRKIDGK